MIDRYNLLRIMVNNNSWNKFTMCGFGHVLAFLKNDFYLVFVFNP